MGNEVEKLKTRLNKLEEKSLDEYTALLEIMSNATFFGNLKKESCQYSKNGQCSRYALKNGSTRTLPVVAQCRIKDCEVLPSHNHIEVSNLACSLCPHWKDKEQNNELELTEKN